MQTAPSPPPIAVDALTPTPVISPAYRLGRTLGWAAARIAGGFTATRKLVMVAPR